MCLESNVAAAAAGVRRRAAAAAIVLMPWWLHARARAADAVIGQRRGKSSIEFVSAWVGWIT